MKIKLNYIFRAPSKDFFSIEKVFSTISQEIQKRDNYAVDFTYLSVQVKGIITLIKNIINLHKHNKADIYHITGDVHFAILSLSPQKTILTIHDCIFLQHSNPLKRFIIKQLYLSIPVRLAKYITVISEATKQEIIQNTSIDANKIFVIPNPVVTKFVYSPKEFNSQLPRILQIGTRSNKNLQNLIPALYQIPCKLVIIGELSDEIKKLLTKYEINYTSLLNISDSELEQEYKNCDIVSFISTYEGFGLPILEAQQIGRVVITSNLEPMKEVVGDGGILVNPYQIESIRDGIKLIINDATLRNNIIYRGQQNVICYQPETIANKYIELYLKI
jgi:glycosyltransferase involved in cell wall biosynthesis